MKRDASETGDDASLHETNPCDEDEHSFQNQPLTNGQQHPSSQSDHGGRNSVKRDFRVISNSSSAASMYAGSPTKRSKTQQHGDDTVLLAAAASELETVVLCSTSEQQQRPARYPTRREEILRESSTLVRSSRVAVASCEELSTGEERLSGFFDETPIKGVDHVEVVSTRDEPGRRTHVGLDLYDYDDGGAGKEGSRSRSDPSMSEFATVPKYVKSRRASTDEPRNDTSRTGSTRNEKGGDPSGTFNDDSLTSKNNKSIKCRQRVKESTPIVDIRATPDEKRRVKINHDGNNHDYVHGDPDKELDNKILPMREDSLFKSTFDLRRIKPTLLSVAENKRNFVFLSLFLVAVTVIVTLCLLFRLCRTDLVNDLSFFLFFWRDFSNNVDDVLFAMNRPLPRLDAKSVYVPGGGFSGFWFTLGRLFSISDPSDHVYYCYSAGCLGVAALLLNATYDHTTTTAAEPLEKRMMNLAFGLQKRWTDGEISRFDLVPGFVNGLIPQTYHDEEFVLSSSMLRNVNVITTSANGPVARRPRDVKHLSHLLIQTAWIPFVTGNNTFTEDPFSGQLHMDGAFSAHLHPKCQKELSLPDNLPDLYANVLNPNLSMDQVDNFFQAGLRYGL